jgi:hypothetical protein
VLEAIDKQRQNSIKAMIEGLHNLLIELRDGQRGCSFACGSMLLGSLMKYMHSNNLLSDLSLCPQAPFSGLSFVGTAAGIRLMKSPPWDELIDHGGSVGNAPGGFGGRNSPFGSSNTSKGSSLFGAVGGGGVFRDDGVLKSNNHSSRFHVCKLEDLIKPILDRVGSTMMGLKLELFSGYG